MLSSYQGSPANDRRVGLSGAHTIRVVSLNPSAASCSLNCSHQRSSSSMVVRRPPRSARRRAMDRVETPPPHSTIFLLLFIQMSFNTAIPPDGRSEAVVPGTNRLDRGLK